ncbi:MAG TPA: peptidase MA family metallohydrolase [Polyangiaceae bacterium]|nr:peptidase MA family metallohydrolase [Polyangiaceae bacterium]
MRRLALLLVLLLSTLLGVTPVSAQSEPRLLAPPAAPVTSGAFPLLGAPATSGSAAAPGRVRTGVTELSGPSAAEPEPPNVSDPDGEVGAPGDAPRLAASIKLPPVPKGWSTFDDGWIVFSYHPSARQRVEPLIAQASMVRAELRRRLGQDVLRRVRVDVARTPGEMEGLAPEGAPYPSYAAGVAYSELKLVLLTLTPRFASAEHDVAEIFRHELAHVALHDAVGTRAVPRWFNEGFAVLASGESSFKRLYTLWTATLSDSIMPLREVERGFPSDEGRAEVAYAQAVDLVRYMIRDQEEHRFHSLIEHLRNGNGLELSVRDSYGVELSTLEYEWRQDIAKRYTFWPVLFSGTAVWACILGLTVWGWRKRRAKAKVTLDRWAREEAADEHHQRRLRGEQPRVHIVLARGTVAATSTPLPTPGEPPEVPKVEHEGQWHTLH